MFEYTSVTQIHSSFQSVDNILFYLSAFCKNILHNIISGVIHALKFSLINLDGLNIRPLFNTLKENVHSTILNRLKPSTFIFVSDITSKQNTFVLAIMKNTTEYVHLFEDAQEIVFHLMHAHSSNSYNQLCFALLISYIFLK